MNKAKDLKKAIYLQITAMESCQMLSLRTTAYTQEIICSNTPHTIKWKIFARKSILFFFFSSSFLFFYPSFWKIGISNEKYKYILSTLYTLSYNITVWYVRHKLMFVDYFSSFFFSLSYSLKISYLFSLGMSNEKWVQRKPYNTTCIRAVVVSPDRGNKGGRN